MLFCKSPGIRAPCFFSSSPPSPSAPNPVRVLSTVLSTRLNYVGGRLNYVGGEISPETDLRYTKIF